MGLDYSCERCGRKIGFKGICFDCRYEIKKEQCLEMTDEQIEESINEIANNIHKISDWKDEFNSFWRLLAYRNICSSKIQKVAFEEGIFSVPQVYYKASVEIRDGIIDKIEHSDNQLEISRLLTCLVFQGDETVLNYIKKVELENKKWINKLYVKPSVYTNAAGWGIDKTGKRISVNYDRCYPLVKEKKNGSPIQIGYIRKDSCPHCKGQLIDILKVDGKDKRLNFLETDDVITATCCPNCVCYTEVIYSEYQSDGTSKMKDFDVFMIPDYVIEDEVLDNIKKNTYGLADQEVPQFYGAYNDNENTIGGFPFWEQDFNYTTCPKCGKTMKLLGQLHWSAIDEWSEGTLYIEVCTECRITSVQHQQT